MDTFPHWIDHILAFLLCIAIPFYGGLKRRDGFPGVTFSSEQKKGIYISGSFSLFIMGAVVMLVWLLFGRPISEIGLTRPTEIRLWWWMVIIFILIYLLDSVVTLCFNICVINRDAQHFEDLCHSTLATADAPGKTDL